MFEKILPKHRITAPYHTLAGLDYPQFPAWAVLLISSGCTLFTDSDQTRATCDPELKCGNMTDEEWTSLGLVDETITAIAVNPCNDGHILAGSLWNASAGTEGKIFMYVN